MKTIKKVAEVFTGGNEIATTIDSTSTNSEVAGAKAVYDLVNRPKATYVLDNSLTITPVTSYSPIDITTMSQDYNNDTSTFSFNASTGEITVLKNGTYQFEVTTQIRGSVNTTSSVFSQKGFGFRTYRSGTLVETFTITEQCYLTEYSNLFGKVSYTMQSGDVIKPMGYSRVMSGTAGSVTTSIWGYKRTSIDIQFIEETTATRSLNLMKSTNEEELEEVKQEETKEPILEEIVQEETKAEGSGDAR